jgi:hypothetical protein
MLPRSFGIVGGAEMIVRASAIGYDSIWTNIVCRVWQIVTTMSPGCNSLVPSDFSMKCCSSFDNSGLTFGGGIFNDESDMGDSHLSSSMEHTVVFNAAVPAGVPC